MARIVVVKPQSGAAFEFLTEDDKVQSDLTKLLQKLDADLAAQPATTLDAKLENKQKRQQ